MANTVDWQTPRLDGWKEIAAYLKKSVRTVSRWEARRGLPVYRVGDSGGTVWAQASEIDAWLAGRRPARSHRAPEKPVAPDAVRDGAVASTRGRARRPLWLVASSLTSVLLAVCLVRVVASRTPLAASSAPGDGGRDPAGWKVEGGTLRVFSGDGTPLWTHRFPFPLAARAYEGGPDVTRDLVEIADLDGDGPREVVFTAQGLAPSRSNLYCFEADGRLRFRRVPGRAVRFGGQTYEPPFHAAAFTLGHDRAGRVTVWLAANHHNQFPSVVEQLAADGRVLREHWAGGHVRLLRAAELGGRRVILVGGTRNEDMSGMLTIIDPESPSSSAPAENRAYGCTDCAAGWPAAHFAFPRTTLSRRTYSRPTVDDVAVSRDGHLAVRVVQANFLTPAGQRSLGEAYYVLDASLRVARAELGDLYRQAHFQLELQGKLDDTMRADEGRELFPVRAWYGKSGPHLLREPTLRASSRGR